eukprot:CAMPEP_0204353310 /NCGR_PEP_ID=MMETSP0469-20131031/32577_1 /ASSEMBLY_ACC=CAM_ASM_000384 /TAXON_ID=2969 /ORGANISM="Oxyrrhis marina" /LENGTH=33 /DNA_ID= /DNA_START= /DNA_END= /DNA_ORIENTATION=
MCGVRGGEQLPQRAGPGWMLDAAKSPAEVVEHL